jgi:hypothetical protein
MMLCVHVKEGGVHASRMHCNKRDTMGASQKLCAPDSQVCIWQMHNVDGKDAVDMREEARKALTAVRGQLVSHSSAPLSVCTRFRMQPIGISCDGKGT